MRKSLRTRLTVYFIALALVPLLLVGALGTWLAFNTQVTQALDAQDQVAKRVSEQVRNFIQAREKEMRALTDVRGLSTLSLPEQNNLLATLFARQDEYEALVLVDSRGAELIYLSRTSLVTELGSRADADEFLDPKETTKTYFGNVVFDEVTGEPTMLISLPLLNLRTGDVAYVLIAKIRFKAVWDIMTDADVIGGGSVYMVNTEGVVVAHANPSIVLQHTRVNLPEENSFTTGLSGGNAAIAVERVTFGEKPFYIVAEQPAAEALSLAVNSIILILSSILVAIVVAGFLGVLAARQITTPIGDLAQMAQSISEGDLTQTPQVAAEDEIGALGSAFAKMTEQLRDLISSLESRVAERTQNLLTAAEVSRATIAVLEMDKLLPQVVNLIRDRFNLYYVGLFLVDETGEWTHDRPGRWAVLRAGTGEPGHIMMERGHKLEVGGRSMIGRCVASGEADIQLDVGEAAVHFDNPDLPDTHSEMALPLRVRDQVVGAVTVQSVQAAAFDEADVAVMQTMVDQVATAIDNARLFSQVQQSLEVERRVYGELTRETWQQQLQSSPAIGFLSNRRQTIPASGFWRPEMHTALRAGQAVQDPSGSMLSIPIRVRDQVIGVIGGRKAEGNAWAPEEIGLLQTLSDQLGVALESARLYQDTQRRAARERLSAQVTARMRESLDMETVLRTAVAEMRQALELEGVVVQLARPEETAPVADEVGAQGPAV